MAFDTYMQFKFAGTSPTGTPYLKGESQVQVKSDTPLGTDIQAGFVFEIDDFNFDIEQVLNIGSQSSGAGAGKVTFNPFTITRKTDRASPTLFTMCCSGQHFESVSLYIRRAGGGGSTSSGMTSGWTFLRFDFALVAVKTISWSGSDGDESPKEEVAFEYGALQARYVQQNADGSPMTSGDNQTMGSWNRVYNNNSFSLSGIKAT